MCLDSTDVLAEADRRKGKTTAVIRFKIDSVFYVRFRLRFNKIHFFFLWRGNNVFYLDCFRSSLDIQPFFHLEITSFKAEFLTPVPLDKIWNCSINEDMN
jgi:hypothetical protein